jgi:hypothetical protein
VYEAFLVREVAPELLAVAADLRLATVDVCGVARVERLLTIGTSPLYGTRGDELRAELERVRADLARGRLCDEKEPRSRQRAKTAAARVAAPAPAAVPPPAARLGSRSGRTRGARGRAGA